MAEFKLGRIRFVWQGSWVTGTTYAIDDVISKGGKSYICVVNHVASTDFTTDLNAIPSKWNIVADGTTWRGEWTPQTGYDAGDEVKYGGVVYICELGHTSAGTNPSTVTVTGLTINNNVATLTFDAITPSPFPIGSSITVSGINDPDPSDYNGTFTVKSTTTTSVSFQVVSTEAYVSGGSIYTFGGLEATLNRWTTFARSFNYLGNWTTSQRYKLNDFVAYGGFVYICTVPHVSASLVANGLEADQNKWQIFNQGIVYLGNWNSAALPGGTNIRYRLNDVVKWGADLWICTDDHTSSGTTLDITKFAVFVNGFQFENSWNNSTTYQIGDTVTYGGYSYIARQNNVNQQPTTNADDWDVFTTGFNFRSEWDVATAYKVGDVVRVNGYTYVANLDNTGFVPPNVTYWSRLNSGIYWTNVPQTYLGVAGTNVSGTGIGAQFDITRSGTVYTVTVTAGQTGASYAATNIIKILGSNIGGITPANDLLITVSTVASGAIDTFTWAGRSATWTTGTVYVLGDAVLFGGNSYICVQPHTGSSPTRPDNDISATYWNVLTIGSEVNVLTTEGDMIYYGPNGPTRLPVGVDGQILRSTDGFPAWANYGLINNLVYVGPLGRDVPAPSSGLTIDKPWKTVRYANKQVEEGYQNPEAKSLLQRNKQFFLKEVENYLYYTHKVTVTGFSTGTYRFTCASNAGLIPKMPISFKGTALGGISLNTTYYVCQLFGTTEFTISNTYAIAAAGTARVLTGTATGSMEGRLVYDRIKTERDTGYIVDSIVYDLTRGGTSKTVSSGRAYFSTAGNAYITAMTGYLVPNFVGAHVYLKTLLANVLANTAPAINYQALNGMLNSERAIQTIDTAVIPEPTALAYLTSLVDIISNALVQGSSTALPIAIQPNTSIMIKTGTYAEILPIYVSENTALVGDELRTSVIQPAQAIPLLAKDKSKTISALNRISDLMPSIVTNATITPTNGNIEPQVYLGYATYASTTASTSINSNMTTISDIVGQGLAAVPSFTITDPTSYDTGYFNARRLIVANKAFLVSEISAWINKQITDGTAPFVGFVYGGVDQTSCERDVGYIVDALRYDLTYGGNLETSVAARSYYTFGTYVGDPASKLRALAVQARIKDIIDNIAIGSTAGWVKTTGLTQDVSGTAGSAGAATFAQARIQEIYDAINTGTTPTTILPSTTWVAPALLTANTVLQYKKSELQGSALNYVRTMHPTLVFDTLTCSRDVGYIIDALCYDFMFGSNFRSVKSGMSYYQLQASVVVGGQKNAQLGLLTYLNTEVTKLATDALNISVVENLATISNIVDAGLSVVPSFVLTNPTDYNTSYLVGYGDAKAQLLANRAFLVSEVSAWIDAQIAGNIAPFVGFVYAGTGRTKCERDVGYIVDAIRYDLTYGGNLETSAAARSYYSFGVFVETGEKLQALAVQARIKDIIDNIIIANTAGWTKNTVLSQDVSGTAGSAGAAIFAQARIQEIYDTIDTGNEPNPILPSTAWVSNKLKGANAAVQSKKPYIQAHVVDWVQTNYPALDFDTETCSRDVGYIVDALCYDFMFGSNFRSIKAGMSYYQAQAALVVGAQKAAQLGMLNNLVTIVTDITAGSVGSIGSRTAITRSTEAAQNVYDILANGLGSVPTLQLPTPTNYNTASLLHTAYATTGNTTGSTLSYGDGRAQIVQNYAFIKAEITAWLADAANGYSTVWAALGAAGQASTISDVGHILDAVRYDITYGGNTQTLLAGSAYFSYSVRQIRTEYLAMTLAAQGRLKAIISSIANKNTVLASSGNVTPQVTTGTVGAGGPYAGTFAQDRVQNIIDYVTTGTAPTRIEPCMTWVSAELQKSYAAVVTARNEIASDANVWIKKYFQEVAFNSNTSERDAGYIVDAIAYDMVIGSNFASTKAGMAFYRPNASAQALLATNQAKACLGAINFIKHKLPTIAAAGASVQAQNIIAQVVNHIPGGAVPRFTWPDPSNIDSGYAAAAKLIFDNKSFIQAEIGAYLTLTYPSLEYSQAICLRDVGYIVDAFVYDLKYGGNYASKQAAKAYYSFGQLQIYTTEKTATLDAYARLKTVVQSISTDSVVTASVGNTALQIRKDALQLAGSAGASTQVGVLADIVTNIIDLGDAGVPKVTITAIAGGKTFTSGTHGLKIGDIVIPQSSDNGLVLGTTYYVKTIPLGTTFTLSATWQGTEITTFTNGTGLNIIAETTIMPVTTHVSTTLSNAFITLNGYKSTMQANVTTFITENYPTLVYNSQTCLRDVGYVIDAIGYDMMLGSNFQSVKAAMSYYRAQSAKAVGAQKRATVQTFRFLRTEITSTLAAYSTTVASARALMAALIRIIDEGIGEVSETYGTLSYRNDIGIAKGADILRANADFLASEATAWVNSSFGATVTSISLTAITTTGAHRLSVGDPVRFTGVSAGGVTVGTTYYVLAVPTNSTLTLSATPTSIIAIPLSVESSPNLDIRYFFNQDSCKRDMVEFVLALVYDLQLTGNYKSLRAATLYKNAVEGSVLSDMFLVRNACGIRNMTLNGLNGDMTEENDYGTKRPTAGAYTSLDPGFGPNDSNAWVTLRSCYTQNVSLFGTGCSGMKIDGALHAGGNRSIVANDYTTILSDGLGVWCTGHNSLTELVSVFCYYSYSGYLAELGGRMRATNGNSSYGTYGVIAEGTDSEEIPLYSILDNRASDATVQNVITDGINKVLRFEYLNAGGGYTNYDPAVSGAGFNTVAVGDEFRDAAMFETRLIDSNDGNGYGGTNYGTAINASQLGDLVSITISATDVALSTAYIGMRIHLTAGSGVGQYANILDYSNGTKVAKVYKDSFVNLIVTASSNSNDTLTVASTATLYANMPIYLGTAIAGTTANIVYYVKTISTATTFTISETSGGATFNINADTSGQSVTLYAAGWDHVVPGTTLVTPLDLTTTYIIEPRINFSEPGYTATARTLSATTTWGSVMYGANRFISVATGGTATGYSTNGTSWQAGGVMPSSAAWIDPVFGGGFGATATATVGGLGGDGAVLIAVLGIPNSTGAAAGDQVASVTIVNGGYGYTSPPTIVFTPTVGGANASAICQVLDGAIIGIQMVSFGSGYVTAPTVSAATDRVTVIHVNTWGRGYLVPPTVTFSGGGASVQATATALVSQSGGIYEIRNDVDGVTVYGTPGSGYTSAPTVTITDATAAFATLVPGANTTAYLLSSAAATANWTSGGTLPATTFTSIAYGNGIYAAVGGTSSAASTGSLPSNWSSRTIPTLGAGTYSALAYGGTTFVAISTGNTATAYSTNGTSWTAGGALPANTTWTSIAYGNGRFVALAVTGRVAYSIDAGLNWINAPSSTGTTGSILSSTYTWTQISYGQGLFFAIATGTTVCATSPDGVNWTVRAMPSSSAWSGIAFGNPGNNPIWVGVSATSGQIGASILTGARALGRMRAVAGTLLETRVIEPGSGYPKGTVTATTVTTNLITVDKVTNLVDSQPIEFTGLDAYGLTTNTTYYVIGSTIAGLQFKVSATAGSATAIILSTGTSTTATYRAAPILIQTDPNKVITAGLRARMGDGALGNPTFTNRGTLQTTATALLTGDGYADFYQATNFISVNDLSEIPQPGSNIVFDSIPGEYYKLVTISNILALEPTGEGNYSATFQISPSLTVLNAPAYGNRMTITIKYSQVRLTGHDFLYIGTGNQASTNYPFVDPSQSSIAAQTEATAGGRVFFTSTDQDGNFNVGNLFGVQQATGTATLNANAFNLSGLQSLQLSGLSLGVGSATITQFSTDPYFTANSDNILPTQRAIKSYITAQIGGGLSQLNVNTLTAGVVYIANNTISTTSGGQLRVTAKMNFTGGIDGAPVALGFFLSR